MENDSCSGEKEKKFTPIQVGICLFLIVFLGIGWKWYWLSQNVFPFNSDEAIVGLMARHILQGARPAFFYGQAYMGSLDAFLVAILFLLFGESVLLIRILQTILYSFTIITTAMLGKSITNSWSSGLISALLLAIPAVNLTLYTTISLGGYSEGLLISNITFLCAAFLYKRIIKYNRLFQVDWLILSVMCLIAGLGFWVIGITLVAVIPAVLLVIYATQKQVKLKMFFVVLVVMMGSFILGSAPWWVAGLKGGFFSSISELTGSAVTVEGGNWAGKIGMHLFNFFILGLPAFFGLRPPWEVRWLVLPLLPFVLSGWILGFIKFSRLLNKTQKENKPVWWMLIGSTGLLLFGFVFTSFGSDPSGRYFLPLAVPFAIMLGWVIQDSCKIKWKCAVPVLILLSFHAVGTWQSAVKLPPGITTQFDPITWIDHRYDENLMDFLRENGETRGYSNYWVAYPMAFMSEEKIIFSPRLPYHQDLRYTTRDDRIPGFTQLVANAEKTAYITTHNPALDEKLAREFETLGITWKEKVIGDYRVYFHLSRAVHPMEIGLGTNFPANMESR